MQLLVDSTGLRWCGAGEWRLEKHGTKTRRSWRKLHIGLDAGSGQIVVASLTAKEVDDGAEVGPLLDQITGEVASFTGDGGYDQDRVYAGVAERCPEAASDRSVAEIVKARAKAAGLEPAAFAGHSLRAGFLTSAARARASIWRMQEQSRHKSLNVLSGYVRSAQLFEDHAGKEFA